MIFKITISLLAAVVAYSIITKVWRQQFQPMMQSQIRLFVAGFLTGTVGLWLVNPQDFTMVHNAIASSLIGGSITGVLFAVGMPKRYRYFVTHIQSTTTKSQPSKSSVGKPKIDHDSC